MLSLMVNFWQESEHEWRWTVRNAGVLVAEGKHWSRTQALDAARQAITAALDESE